jgi:hypothetical protein
MPEAGIDKISKGVTTPTLGPGGALQMVARS